jgi:hypothetical protein
MSTAALSHLEQVVERGKAGAWEPFIAAAGKRSRDLDAMVGTYAPEYIGAATEQTIADFETRRLSVVNGVIAESRARMEAMQKAYDAVPTPAQIAERSYALEAFRTRLKAAADDELDAMAKALMATRLGDTSAESVDLSVALQNATVVSDTVLPQTSDQVATLIAEIRGRGDGATADSLARLFPLNRHAWEADPEWLASKRTLDAATVLLKMPVVANTAEGDSSGTSPDSFAYQLRDVFTY